MGGGGRRRYPLDDGELPWSRCVSERTAHPGDTNLSTDLLISSDPWENRVAILEDGKLSEYYIERDERVIGSIYKGKVQNVLPGMGASFVDIGLGRNAFLYVDDINKTPLNIGDVEVTGARTGWTINEKVSKGDDVLVQIVKEPRGLKGARVSTNISLPGRYLILMPTGKYSGVSRKIESADERNRLKGVMKAIRPEGMATVVRTAAGGVSNAELIADLGVLIRMWHGILENYKSAPTPSLLHKDMNLVYKAARDFITPEVQNVWIDDADEAERVRDFMRLLGPQYVERIKPYPGGAKLFADFKIDEEVAKLMKPTVKTPSGGSIVIESTEALTVIDVNSGKFTGGKNLDDTIVKTNIEAAAEIARQVRLRDIGGIIVCDFIDMSSENDRNKVLKTLEDGLRKDRTRSTIQSFSPLGLLEFTRKRVGKDLAGQLRAACPTCSGLGSVMSPESVTIETFREIAHHQNGHAAHVHVAASPTVAAQIEFWYDNELETLKERVGKPIDVRVDPAVHPERPLVTWDDGMPELPPIRVGDEYDVELLGTRLPTATSAAAVVNGRLIEVENAANAAGNLIKVRILDVDGTEILAEPRYPIAAGVSPIDGERKKRRRRGGKGRKPLTAAEQQEELRELAEEAAKGLGARPALGISTNDEAAAEENVASNQGAPKHATPAALPSVAAMAEDLGVQPPLARPSRGRPGRTDRTDRPARAASSAAPAPAPSAPVAPAAGAFAKLPGESLSGAMVAKLPGETLSGNRVAELAAAVIPPPVAVAAAPAVAVLDSDEADDLADEALAALNGGAGKRRRRRRRRGRGSDGEAAGLNGDVAAADADAGDDAEDDEDEAVAEAAGIPPQPGEIVEIDGRKKRRRRRRRRGRGGSVLGADAAATPAAGESTALPDRHIIRVDGDGAAHPTGETAPPAPNRAIAPWNRPKKGEVAIEPPPPSLTAPVEPAPDLKVAAPARGRRTTRTTTKPAEPIAAAAPVKALPAPARAATTRTTAAKRPATTRATAKKSPATKAPAAKATAAKATAAKAPAKKVTATKAAAKKTAPAKATAAKKAPAAKKATAKKTVAKKTTAAKKTSRKT
jgi:ribonuclease G